MPRVSPAFPSLSVIAMSSLLGVGSPLGWLWTKMTDAAASFIASLNDSRGCIREAVRVPSISSGPDQAVFHIEQYTVKDLFLSPCIFG